MQLHPLPPPDAIRHLVPLVERASRAHRQGATETAERLCLDVLELAPDRPGALSILYEIRKAQGKSQAAEALIRRIVTLDPNNIVATNELALILLGKGNLAEAERHARNAVRIAPENPQAHNLMGMIMTEANRPQVGEYHYRRVLELTAKREPVLLANLAWNLKNQGRMPEARALYEESVGGRAEDPPDAARVRTPGRSRPRLRRSRQNPGQGRCAIPQRSGHPPDTRCAAWPHAEIRRGTGADRRVGG